MGAHAVRSAVSWSVVTVAELFRRDVVDLRKRRRRRKRERDFIDERNYVISGRGDCGRQTNEMTNSLNRRASWNPIETDSTVMNETPLRQTDGQKKKLCSESADRRRSTGFWNRPNGSYLRIDYTFAAGRLLLACRRGNGMAGIFSRRDVAAEFLGRLDGSSSAGSRKPRPAVDGCKSRPEDSVPWRGRLRREFYYEVSDCEETWNGSLGKRSGNHRVLR